MPPRTRSSSAKKRPAVADYSSESSIDYDDVDSVSDTSDDSPPPTKTLAKKKAPARVPKKKLKKSTEERIKEVVGDDSQNVEEENDMNKMVDDEGESGNNINTKRLLDARSKKAKRMDWEQGFFYLPKFDCYLPRHILHMILDYIPPFPYFLNIRSISQQWLDDFDTVICQNVKELDLLQRNDIDYETVKYHYPWYDYYDDTRRNNDCIRFLAILFPNIEKLIVPSIGEYTSVRVPNNVLTLFTKLQKMEIFYVSPITLDVGRIIGEIPLTYRQDITNIQAITFKRYLTQFSSSLVMVADPDNSVLITVSNCLIPENVIALFKYLVKEQHFSLKRLNVLSLPTILYSKALIDFILEENVKQVERGYGAPELTSASQILYIEDEEIIDYMYEKQFIKNLVSPKDIASYDWDFISQILSYVNSPKALKMLFEQSNFPLVFDEQINPLVFLIKNNSSTHISEIIELLCTINPSLTTLGDEKGVVKGNEKNFNILEFYIRTINDDLDEEDEEESIEEDIISSLIKAGYDVKFVCPTTGNNLIHIHPFSLSLIDAVPVEYFQMKNNKGYNPLERLVKRFEIAKDIDQEKLLVAIEAFGKAYSKFGLSINDLKFEKNQNLLHKLINLSDARGMVSKLIESKVDANAIDEDGNIPLFYFLMGRHRSDVDLKALIDSISEETLTRRYDNKTFLTNIIERLDSDEPTSEYSLNTHTTTTLDLLENLLSRGCNLNEAISELSDTYYEKGNLDHNKSLFIMQLFYTISSSNLETLRKIFKYVDNFEDILTKACIVNGTAISPLLYVLTFWSKHRSGCHSEINATFFSEENPLIPAKLLENIIDIIPNKKIDALYYSIISSESSINWQYLEGILGVKVSNTTGGWWYRPTNFTEIAKYITSYRHEDEVYGNLNVVHLVVLMGNTKLLQQIHQIFSDSAALNILDDLYNESFKNGTTILDELAKRGLFVAGDMYMTTKEKWTIKHFRLAFESNHFQFCYYAISDDSYVHDFTKEEILQILIAVLIDRKIPNLHNKDVQSELVELIASHFSDLTLEERFKLFSRRFKIILNNEEQEEMPQISHNNSWLIVLERALFEAKSAWFKQNTPKKNREYHLSLLDVCYWKVLINLLFYIILEDTTGRKKKNILVSSDLNKDLLLSWITAKCDHTGKTVIHFACQKSDRYNLLIRNDMVNDLVNYLSTVDREDALNIQDNELRTPAFYSLKSGSCVELIFSVTDLTLKNNKGETVKDLMNDEEKVTYAKFFEKKQTTKKAPTRKKKEETKPKKKTTTRRKKQESDEEFEMSDEEEEKPARKTRTSTRRKK